MQTNIRKSDKYIPWYFVAFFLVIAIVDGIFVTVATSTHTGVVTENAYKKGLNYNETIAASDQQNKLGWDAQIAYAKPALSFSLKDANNAAIIGAKVTAHITRVTQSGHEFTLPLTDNKDGTYSHNVAFPLKGLWNVGITAQWKQQNYQKSKRIIAK